VARERMSRSSFNCLFSRRSRASSSRSRGQACLRSRSGRPGERATLPHAKALCASTQTGQSQTQRLSRLLAAEAAAKALAAFADAAPERRPDAE
jgi:hypothetical protein